MYSGTTLRNKSGRLMGVHQKIDRVARKHVAKFTTDDNDFPSSKQILQFEGKNGPDGIKRKSPSVDEPWHFIDPTDVHNSPLLTIIEQHLTNLTQALVEKNTERASFESAWLAHAVTDGLTPAHHYPLEEKLRELRNGEGNETRTSVVKKNLMKGDTKLEAIKNNWRYWGAKGAMTTHLAFESGVASVIAYQRFISSLPTDTDLRKTLEQGYIATFCEAVAEIDSLKMYDKFQKSGWTTHLAKQTNEILMPIIIRTVTLGWLYALNQSRGPHGSN